MKKIVPHDKEEETIWAKARKNNVEYLIIGGIASVVQNKSYRWVL